MSTSPAAAPHAVLYDDECSMCTFQMKVLTWLDWRGVLLFSAVGVVLVYLLQRLQEFLPYSLGLSAPSEHLAFNTAASFVANTTMRASLLMAASVSRQGVSASMGAQTYS